MQGGAMAESAENAAFEPFYLKKHSTMKGRSLSTK